MEVTYIRMGVGVSVVRKASLILITLLAFLGCKKVDDFGFTTYLIKKCKHKSTYAYKTTKSELIQFQTIFDGSAIYTTKDSLNQYDINKLYGVSDCGCNHMDYSIRFGWRWLDDNLEIHWFRHSNGDFTFDKITDAIIDQTQDYSIEIQEDQYILCVDNICDTVARVGCSSVDYRRYYLYPYFGGQEKAPHDITIKIKK